MTWVSVKGIFFFYLSPLITVLFTSENDAIDVAHSFENTEKDSNANI